MAPRKSNRSLPKTLSVRQQDALNAIREYIREQGLPPTVSELAERMGLTGTTVQAHLNFLERKGFIRREGTKARNLRVVLDEEERTGRKKIPILGHITAGVPIEAIEYHEGYLSVDPEKVRGENLFALRVRGDSMVMDGIINGDCAIVRPQPQVENGEIAVAMIDGEATIKRFYLQADGSVTLKPSNPQYTEKTYEPGKVAIHGKVIAVQRYIES